MPARKTIEQKRVTARSATRDVAGRPLPAPATLVAIPGAKGKVPPVPDRLIADGPGAERWRKLWKECPWISPAVDSGIMERLCEAEDSRWIYRQQLAADGVMIVGSAGQTARHPLIPEIRQLDDQITRYEGQLGLTPSSRATLNVAEVENGQNATANLVNSLVAQQARVNGSRG